jgi:hypothetical protein
MHKTMGGYHFGNRYTADAMPFVFLWLLSAFNKRTRRETFGFNWIFVLIGFAMNIYGSIIYYS